MVRVPGRPGKMEGSPAGPKEFEQEFYTTRSETANFLRQLADEIEAGGVVEASAESWNLGVNPMEPLKLEVQYKFDKRELEVQVKLKESP